MMNNFQMPIQLMKMLKGGNPQQVAMNILQQSSSNNPMLQNVMTMMNNKDERGIEQFARNLCASKGINADEMFNQIQQNFQ